MTETFTAVASEPNPSHREAKLLAVGCDCFLQDVERSVGHHGGHPVLGAGSGEAALDILTRDAVDLVLAEQALPDTTGVDLLELASAIAPETVRILATEEVDTPLAFEVQERAKAFRLLVQPVSQEELRRAILDGLILRLGAAVGEKRKEWGAAGNQRDEALSTLLAGILEIGPEGFVTSANEAARLILGTAAADEIVGKQAVELGLPCRASQGPAKPGKRALCGHRGVRAIEVEGKRGSILWSCEPRQFRDGSLAGCVASFVETTGRSDLELKIYRAKQELEAIFDSVTDPTFLIDDTFRIRRANEALSRLLETPFHEILGRSCSAAMDDLGAGRLMDRLASVFETKSPAHDEFRLPNGRIHKIHLFPLLRDGRVSHVVVRYQDVTSERQLEEQLLQSERMASVGQLSAGIAHEINNPMGFIHWNLNRLAEYLQDLQPVWSRTESAARRVLSGEGDALRTWQACAKEWEETEVGFLLEDAQNLVRECNEGAGRVKRIIADLKSFAHPGANRGEYADIHEGLDSTINIVWNELKHRCELVKQYGDLPRIFCHPQRLNQVFMNLLINGAQAMPDKGTLTVKTRRQRDEVSVSISDTGQGIPPEHLHRIFDPFFTTKPVSKGTGLGLHVALGIVRSHGGDLLVESAPGEGSTFTVVLPIAPPDVKLPESSRKPKPTVNSDESPCDAVTSVPVCGDLPKVSKTHRSGGKLGGLT